MTIIRPESVSTTRSWPGESRFSLATLGSSSMARSRASPAQHAAAVALTMPQDCVEEMRKAFEMRRDRAVELINQISGLSCRKPHGAFYVMINIRGIVGKRFGDTVLTDSNAVAQALLEHAHVALVPGAAFLDEGFCRLSYATSLENIEEGLRRVAAFVKELKD